MRIIDTTKRTQEEEIMDDFYLKGKDLERTLADLDKVNRWLGGNQITLDGIKKLLPKQPFGVIKIIDIGCGNGMILREIAAWGKKEQINFELIGIDANTNAIDIARRLSTDYPNISFKALNIFSDTFDALNADIFLCTLTLHHFKKKQIHQLLQKCLGNCSLGIVINDLQRSRSAYYLFQAFCFLFIHNEIAKKDGLISIRRGFKRKELEDFSKDLNTPTEIDWKWAFRYQWILYKKHE